MATKQVALKDYVDLKALAIEGEVSSIENDILNIQDDIISLSGEIDTKASTTFVTATVSSHNIAPDSHQDIRNLIVAPTSLSGYAMLSGAVFTGNITAANLSGINTGDQDISGLASEIFVTNSVSSHNVAPDAHQDIRNLIVAPTSLSGYAMLSGAVFTGNISAANLSGTNTGDQDLSPYALNTTVTDAVTAHNVNGSAHQDIRTSITNVSNSLSGYQTRDEKNQNNGYAPLDSGGKVPLQNLPSTLLQYIGVWNALTNTPTITSPDLTKVSNVYNVSVSGTQFGIDFSVGDWAIYNASGIIEKSDNSDDVKSVNSQTGIIVLTTDNISDTTTHRYTNDSDISRLSTTSGNNTGDQDLSSYATQAYVTSSIAAIPSIDLSPYATLSGSTFLGNITATNLSGINTGDQDLSPYALNTTVTQAITAHNVDNSAHQDIRNAIPSIVGLASETFVTNAVSSHNENGTAHQDIRTSVTNVSNSLSSYVPYVGAIQGLNLGSYDLSAANLEDYKTFSGFENRTDSTIAIDGSGVFTLSGASFNVYTNGYGKHTLTGTQTVTVTADQTISYIYVNNAGVLSIMETPWTLTSGVNAPCAIVFKDGTSYALTDERHSYERNRAWHNWAHNNIGAMYRSGFTGTFTTTNISVTQGVVSDEDIAFDTLTTKTATTLWYRNATTGMRMIRNSAVAKATTGGVLAWDDGSGTLQQISANNRFATNWVYATADTSEPIYTVVSQADYATIGAARNALSPTINLSTAEWKLLYRVIYQRTVGTQAGVFVEATDFRTVQTGVPTAAVSTDHASLINRDAANSHPATAISYGVSDVDTALTNLSNSLSGYSTTGSTTLAISSHNIANDSHQDIRNLIPSITGLATETFVTSSISEHNASETAHNDIRNLIPSIVGVAYLSGATFTGNITALNLSGVNTGDQDLSSYATIGSLSDYALQTFVTSSISEHNINESAHQDIRNAIPSITGLATEAFATAAVTAHNIDDNSHSDIRALITSPTSLSGYAMLSGATFTGDVIAPNITKLITQSKSFNITNPTSGKTYSVWRAPYDLTIIGLHGVQVGGTNLVGMLTECDSNGLNPVKINSTDTTILTSNVSLSSFSNSSIDSGDYIGWSTTSISGTVSKLLITFDYTRN